MKQWTVGNQNRHKADLRLNDETVSAVHANLVRTDDGRWKVEDRNSTNGIVRFVNGRWVRIKQAYVSPDERLRFGRAETTVRQLLMSRHDGPAVQPQHAPIPWTHDLHIAFAHIANLSELKKNLFFVVELIASPAHRIMRCVEQRQPVNPFSFLMFGGLIYTIASVQGVGLSTLVSLVASGELSRLMNIFHSSVSDFLLLLTFTLIVNVVPYRIYLHFSAYKRSFDDFMRFTAVISGMSCMIWAFLLLTTNDIRDRYRGQSLADVLSHDESASRLVVLAMVSIIYMSIFSLIGQKHFWRITYTKAVICYVMTIITVMLLATVLFLPVAAMAHSAG